MKQWPMEGERAASVRMGVVGRDACAPGMAIDAVLRYIISHLNFLSISATFLSSSLSLTTSSRVTTPPLTT